MNTEQGAAYFDDAGIYRYALSRVWDKGPMMLFVGLNPSTADEERLDPTLRRVAGFARREGCGGMWIGNLFAFRATKPADMKAQAAPVGPENDTYLLDMAKWCTRHIVLGWGAHGNHRQRDEAVLRLLNDYNLQCWGVTRSGQPRHPLYLAAKTKLVPYRVTT